MQGKEEKEQNSHIHAMFWHNWLKKPKLSLYGKTKYCNEQAIKTSNANMNKKHLLQVDSS